MLLKIHRRDIGLWLFGAVSSPALKIGITFAILSFMGKVPDSMEALKIQAKGTHKICCEHFRRNVFRNAVT